MLNDTLFRDMKADVLTRFEGALSDNDSMFIERIFAPPPNRYANRLKAVGFDQCSHVLDAGCGFGQWAVCLADMCGSVVGVEHSPLRVEVANYMFEKNNIGAKALNGSIHELPLPDESFDGVFCYGTIFCTPWKESLAEMMRVLRPGGRLYFTANDLGYILNMWLNRPNRQADFDPREAAAHTFLNTLRYEQERIHPEKGQIIITQDEAVSELESLGFSHIEAGSEGTINVNSENDAPEPFFQSEYYGFPACYEILAIK